MFRFPGASAVPDALTIGDWRVDPALRTLSGVKGEVHLEPKHMQVLVLLAEHAGQVVSKERLLQSVWEDTFVGDEVLSRAISELRRALGDDSKAPRFIQTIPKGGYRLVAPVRFHSALPTVAGTLAPLASPPRAWFVLWQSGWVLVLVGATVTIGWLVLSRPHRSSASGSPLPLAATRLTSYQDLEGSPTFSPDGRQLAFHANPDSFYWRIFVKPAGAAAPWQLTHGPGEDSYPAWSPDGRTIAFIRWETDDSGLFVVPAQGGRERKLVSFSATHECQGRPRWSPDSRTIVYMMGAGHGPLNCHVEAFSLDTLEWRVLTQPPEPSADVSVAFSPDGRTIALVRHRGGLGDVYLMPADGGPVRRLTFDAAAILGNLAWAPDGKQIVFPSTRDGTEGLWRVSTDTGQCARLSVNGSTVLDPAIDVSGQRFAYVNYISAPKGDSGMYALDLTRPSAPLAPVAPSPIVETGPDYSPDGSRLAFSSGRGGSGPEIWVSEADGTNPRRMTFFNVNSGSPRWSPDGRWIVFDSETYGAFDIFVIPAAGGLPRRLTAEPSNDDVASWSRDGRWIYFASDRTGSPQIWKMPAQGGAARQLTNRGGFGGVESADGRYFYYTKSTREPGIWRVPVGGGREEPVVADFPLARGAYTRYWALVDDGIYFLNSTDLPHPSVEFFAFATRRITPVATLPKPGVSEEPGMAVSPNRRRLVIVLAADERSDIMLVDNFHLERVERPVE